MGILCLKNTCTLEISRDGNKVQVTLLKVEDNRILCMGCRDKKVAVLCTCHVVGLNYFAHSHDSARLAIAAAYM